MPVTTTNPRSANGSHPAIFNSQSSDERAKKLHRLLLDLSRSTEEKEAASAFRQTADFLREKYFGLTEKKIRSAILECLADYFDGEKYVALEADNISDLTGIKEEVLLPILAKMVKAGILVQGRRRRWNELGEHYNAIFRPNINKK